MRDASHRVRSATKTSCRYSANRTRRCLFPDLRSPARPPSRRVLFPIELADRQAAAVLQPLHAEDVMVARIARNFDPSWSAAIHAHHAYAHRRVLRAGFGIGDVEDRKSTRLNSSHLGISYAVFCLKK